MDVEVVVPLRYCVLCGRLSCSVMDGCCAVCWLWMDRLISGVGRGESIGCDGDSLRGAVGSKVGALLASRGGKPVLGRGYAREGTRRRDDCGADS